MKITVLYGGLSPERRVSEVSGKMIANALRSLGHSVASAELYFGHTDGFSSKAEEIPRIDPCPPDLDGLIKAKGDASLIGNGIIELCKGSDAVFLALHGGAGEDGRLQALLDCHGIVYTGAGHLSSALAFDKELTKLILSSNGIPVPRGCVIKRRDDVSKLSPTFPCVIKPSRGGSSVGISIAESKAELEEAVTKALRYCDTVLIEEKLIGRELTVGVLDGKALPAVEIIPRVGFYDYKNKYEKGRTLEICPAQISERETELLSDSALLAASALGIDSYCRVDFILCHGFPYCLEVNTLPGMTETSLLPQETAAVGVSFAELCESIVDIALRKKIGMEDFCDKK